jgi:hypothetical protein
LPIRTIVITLRDSQGLEQQAKIAVAHNFLTGYSIVFTPSTCPTGANACAGGETVVMWDTVTNGVRIGDRPFIVSMVAGPCLFENPPVAGAPGTGNLTTSISTASDHEGKVTVVMYCPANVSPQVGLLRLIDAGSGASTTAAFTVTASAASQGLTAIPASFTFTGPDSATCGSGTADFFVFGGQPPFQAVSSDSSITVTPVDVTHNPAHFQVTAGSASKCVDATVIVTDATGGRTTVEVKTAAGSAPPATQPTPLVLTPSSISLTCGQSTSVLVTGGTGGGSVSFASSDSNLTVTGGSGTLTVKRNGALPVLPGGNHTSTINVTDGTSITTLSVDNPVNCS